MRPFSHPSLIDTALPRVDTAAAACWQTRVRPWQQGKGRSCSGAKEYEQGFPRGPIKRAAAARYLAGCTRFPTAGGGSSYRWETRVRGIKVGGCLWYRSAGTQHARPPPPPLLLLLLHNRYEVAGLSRGSAAQGLALVAAGCSKLLKAAWGLACVAAAQSLASVVAGFSSPLRSFQLLGMASSTSASLRSQKQRREGRRPRRSSCQVAVLGEGRALAQGQRTAVGAPNTATAIWAGWAGPVGRQAACRRGGVGLLTCPRCG